ncbi:MAG: hypothetical protein WC307_01990 [Candidatus Nanoarchaeia archaeon]|jgi:hypothetical protein
MENREKAVSKYEELKTKYSLPELAELEDEFDFELDDDSAIIKTIINQIWDKVSSIKSYIEGILHPQRYCCIIETKFLNNKEKEKVFDFYKKIMADYWKTVKSTFGSQEEKINQVRETYEFYKKVKKFSNEYLNRMIKGWEEEEEKEPKEEYIN